MVGGGRQPFPGTGGDGDGGSGLDSGDGRRRSGDSGSSALDANNFFPVKKSMASVEVCSGIGLRSSSNVLDGGVLGSDDGKVGDGGGCGFSCAVCDSIPPGLGELALRGTSMEGAGRCLAGDGDDVMVDGELQLGGAAGKQGHVLCFVDDIKAPGMVFSALSRDVDGCEVMRSSPTPPSTFGSGVCDALHAATSTLLAILPSTPLKERESLSSSSLTS